MARKIDLPCLFSTLGAMAVIRRCRGDCRSVVSRIFGVHSLNENPTMYCVGHLTCARRGNSDILALVALAAALKTRADRAMGIYC